ncbi:RING-H2 finger protein ATL52-like [Salvia miltiorrhiza]|uniref:RING-H2 finger protein ATL52-like n=1 Tax=Salvia miltiorrhiza TaxID=226208 RepID=UPI0025AC9CBE|nr:RING-H2 finger protein ATL52-like [Salvia miltiorrhiza]
MSASPTASPGEDSSKWDPQVIGMVGLVCSIFLLFSYYKILERNCATIRVSRNREQRRRLNQHLEDFSSQLQSRGLDSYLMHSLPITQIKKCKDTEPNLSSWECAVCLGEFEQGEWVKHLPICSHVFHVSCIDTWFQTHDSCPLCRSYVCHPNTPPQSSININIYLQTLNREDFHRHTSQHYQERRDDLSNS